MGYLIQESEYRTLSLSPKAVLALKNRTSILGQLLEVEERASKKANKQELEYNHALFALLRAKRKELADLAGVPPYVIFPDRTLVEMAAYAPQTPERLLDISGVGQVKSRQYGEAFLEILREYCRKHAIPEKAKETISPATSRPGTNSAIPRKSWRSRPPLPTSRPPLSPPSTNWGPGCSSRSSTSSTVHSTMMS